MALKFRRGTTAQQSGSLAFGEPYVNTTLGTLLIGGPDGDIILGSSGTGSTGNFGAISGSGLDITGNANIAGNLTLGGQLTIGDATSDTVNVVASLSSSLIPQTTKVFDLGSTTKEWDKLYASTANFSGDVNITGSLIASGSNIEFIRDWPAVGSESHFLRLAPFTSSTGRYYDGLGIGVEHWDDGTGTYEHALQIHSFDNHDSPNYGAELNVGPFRTHMRAYPSGSDGAGGHLANISVQDLQNGKSQALVYGDFVQIGNFIGQFITIGNSGSVVEISGSVRANITGSIAATNGVVSGSSQVTLQSTTGFSNYDSALATITGSLISSASTAKTTNDTQDGRLTNIETFSGSALTRLTALEVETSNLETFSGSTIGRLNNLETTSASVNTSITNLNSTTASLTQRVAANEAVSGTFARTNSNNTFSGLQSFNNINVEGTASFAYIQSTTGSSTSIGESFIILNESTPASNFAGIKVVDSGSSFTTASFVYDGLNNNWVFEKANVGSSDTSIAIFGPISTGGLGTEVGLTQNKLPKAVSSHGHHIADSQITDDGTTVSIGGALTVTGNITGPIRATNGVVSGSSQIVGSSITTNTITIGSTSTALGGTSTTLAGLTSVSSTGFTGALTGNASTATTLQTARTINGTSFNGSANITIPNLVSGSSQITAGSTTNFATDVKTQLNSNTVVSGSSQINVASTTGYSTISSHISSTSNPHSVTATQVGLGNVTNESKATMFASPTFTGTVSGVTATHVGLGNVNNTSDANKPVSTATQTALNAKLNINGAGVVSGSAQINVASTTGDIALGTRTSGNYVATITGGTGVSSNGATTGEGIAHTISIGQAVATTDNVRFASIGVGMAANGTSGRIDAANDIVAFSTSDIRFKENITPIENAIDKIRKISGNTYDWKSELKDIHGYEGNDVGVIAQEVEAVLPQLVQNRDNGYKAVKYDKLVALLIEGIKEQQLQIEQLRIDLNNCTNNKGL